MDPSFPPFEFLSEDGQPVGYDVELAYVIAQRWGLKVEVVSIGFDSLLDALRTAQVDSVVSAFPHDPRLTRDVLFSSPYFEAGIRLVVRNGSTLTSVEELTNQSMAVEWGSIGDMVGRRLQQERPALQLTQFATPDDAVNALAIAQGVDVLLIDGVTLRLAQGRGAPVLAVGPALESNPYVVVMPLTATELSDQVEESLRWLRETRTLERLETNWFSAGEE
jgi:polar amino acid transport system substrate-binding protein